MVTIVITILFQLCFCCLYIMCVCMCVCEGGDFQGEGERMQKHQKPAKWTLNQTHTNMEEL